MATVPPWIKEVTPEFKQEIRAIHKERSELCICDGLSWLGLVQATAQRYGIPPQLCIFVLGTMPNALAGISEISERGDLIVVEPHRVDIELFLKNLSLYISLQIEAIRVADGPHM